MRRARKNEIILARRQKSQQLGTTGVALLRGWAKRGALVEECAVATEKGLLHSRKQAIIKTIMDSFDIGLR